MQWTQILCSKQQKIDNLYNFNCRNVYIGLEKIGSKLKSMEERTIIFFPHLSIYSIWFFH